VFFSARLTGVPNQWILSRFDRGATIIYLVQFGFIEALYSLMTLFSRLSKLSNLTSISRRAGCS
jgi:hypothetical protein